MDINSLVANYLSNNSSADAADVSSRLHDLASSNASSMISHSSIFSYGDSADEGELLKYFSEACGQDEETIKEDISLLFDILDVDGSGSLSDEELEIFEREQGTSMGKVDGFGIFNDLINVNEASVNEYMGATESSNDTETTSTTVKSTGLSSDSRIKTDSDGNNYVLVETWKANDSSLNSCLYYIIKHSYDFDELGVSYSDAKDKLLSAIVDTNNISNANLVYTDQKIILPDAYEVLGLDNS